MTYLEIIFIPFLVHILYTDYKQYKINLVTLILILILSIIRFIYRIDPLHYIQILSLNALFIVIFLTIILLISIIKDKNFLQVIGIGDIIFLIITALNFTPVLFNLYILASALISIVYFLLPRGINNNEKRIPFAAILSFVLVVFILADAFTVFSSYDESMYLKILF